MTALARPKPPRMTADEFIAWAMEQPEGERYELVGGEVVEVLSPSTRALDAGAKLDDYFRVPSVRHHLLVNIENRTVIHHARGGGCGGIATRIAGDGAVRLDPPGIALDVAGLFGGVTGKAAR